MGTHISGGVIPANPRGPAITSITFTAGGTGANGTETTLFTVTGAVLVLNITAYVTTDLTESAGTPTLSLGINNDVAIFIAATTATALDAGELWVDTAPDANVIALPAVMKDILVEENISCTVAGTNNISAGVISFSVSWTPISSDGNVAAA
jgi:hypothetical protein